MAEYGNHLIESTIAEIPGLKEFLQYRPADEELGESIDRFRKVWESNEPLPQKYADELRALSSQYFGIKRRDGFSISHVNFLHIDDSELLMEFTNEASKILYKFDEEDLRVCFLADKYRNVDHPYICMEFVRVFNRRRLFHKSSPFLVNAANSTFANPNRYWDNREAIYGSMLLLHSIYAMLSGESLSTLTLSTGRAVRPLLLEYYYLLLSRVIYWPKEIGNPELDDIGLPIALRHKIGALYKRIEMMEQDGDFFLEDAPNQTIPEILCVSDYYLAHEFCYSMGVLGRESQFKRDSRIRYDAITPKYHRPYRTSISDGKDACIELSHRYCKKYIKGEFALSSEEIEELIALAIDSELSKGSSINLKPYSEEIDKYLIDNGIECFYHFTEKENLESIRKNGGLLSHSKCLYDAVQVNTKGNMLYLRGKDASQFLEDYTRLSFCKNHPLARKRMSEGANLVLLKISPMVATFEGTLFADRDAAFEHIHGPSLADLKRVRLSAVKKPIVLPDDTDYSYCQAEIMVHSFLPKEFILNLDYPEEI